MGHYRSNLRDIEFMKHAELTEALGHVDAMVTTMIEWDATAADTPEQIYCVGQNSTRLLMSFGDLLISWLLTRQAVVAKARLDAGPEDAYYAGKVAVARFFTATVLPELAARRRVLEQTDNAITEIVGEAF